MISLLNKFFDKIYYINLDISPDRNEKCLAQFKQYGIEAERISGFLGREKYNTGRPLFDGRMGALSSHLFALNKAITDGYEKALILEDDVILCDDFNNEFQKYIDSMPSDWHMIYLGGNHNYPFVISEHIIKLRHTLANHAYCVKLDFLKKEVQPAIREMWESKHNDLLFNGGTEVPNEYTIDNILAKFQNTHNCYGFTKQLMWQEAGFSITENTYTNFEWILKQEFKFEG